MPPGFCQTITYSNSHNLGITLDLEKCENKFLGQLMDEDEIKPDPNKVCAAQQIKPPRTVREYMTIPWDVKLADQVLASPSRANEIGLRDLLRLKNQQRWGHEQQQAFDDLKGALSMIALYDARHETILSADD